MAILGTQLLWINGKSSAEKLIKALDFLKKDPTGAWRYPATGVTRAENAIKLPPMVEIDFMIVSIHNNDARICMAGKNIPDQIRTCYELFKNIAPTIGLLKPYNKTTPGSDKGNCLLTSMTNVANGFDEKLVKFKL